jgi:hypothetical protein
MILQKILKRSEAWRQKKKKDGKNILSVIMVTSLLVILTARVNKPK